MSTEGKLNSGKFYESLVASGDDVKGKRGELLVKSVKKAAKKKVDEIEEEIDALETTLLNLTDLGPENSYSLRPTAKGFDATKWIDEMFEAKVEIALKKVELEVAEGIVNEWF